jgi:hypothetical protein
LDGIFQSDSDAGNGLVFAFQAFVMRKLRLDVLSPPRLLCRRRLLLCGHVWPALGVEPVGIDMLRRGQGIGLRYRQGWVAVEVGSGASAGV